METIRSTERPLWRTVWSAPEDVGVARGAHPPVALVFTKTMGQEAVDACMRGIAELSSRVWQGTWHPGGRDGERQDGYDTFEGRVPVVACRLDRLQALGPHGPIWWRFGRKGGGESLTAALGDNRYYSYDAYKGREDERRAADEAERARERRKDEEARRLREESAWPCPAGCGRKVYPPDPDDNGDSGSASGGLCHICQSVADREAREAREREEAAAAWAREKRADGWLGWLPGRS
ncbi:hypothetical protein ACFWBC_38870 [Streptomyces sp. NPDC059985]|uniref:hypothetical protein n=1 Tax=Streptomyces sp. NPDC059985 TaxID=3347025 RepID=UPI0036B493D5